MKPPKKAPTTPTAQPAVGREYVRPWLLAAFAAVCVARPLVPSEGVAWLGDGHPFTLALLMLAAACLLLAVVRGGLIRSPNLVDLAVAALVLWCVLGSALGIAATLRVPEGSIAIDHHDATLRPALNMTWEWVGLGLVYFLARQLVATLFEARALVAVMLGLAVAMSGFGLYQVLVTLPAERAAYAENPDDVLMRLGQWYPPDSPERSRFEDRLASSEPLAQFALTNSLAGFLVAWLIVALGVAWSMARKRPAGLLDGWRLARMAGFAAGLLAVLVCLVLTKSRSAYIALAAGCALLPVSNAAFRRSLNWRFVVAAAIVLVLVVGSAAYLRGVDAEVLSEGAKSFRYRIEYWQATLDMIADYSVFGVGLGDFQNVYTQYKLPEASEEVRDPHNFLLEVWATAGTPALLALVALLAGFAWKSWELTDADEGDFDTATLTPASREGVWLLLAGAAAGFPLAFGLGLPFEFYLPPGQTAAGLAIAAATVLCLWPWIATGTLPARLPAVGVLVLSIHWLASGGMTYPGVAGTFWMLLALGLNQGEPIAAASPADATWRRRWGPAAALAVTVAAAVGCYLTGFLPVMACRAAMAHAAEDGLSTQSRIAALLRATAADRFSAEPWIALAHLSKEHLKYAEGKDMELWRNRLIRATTSAIALQSRSSAVRREMAALYRELYELGPDPHLAEWILKLARDAAFLYPNSAVIQAEYAEALAEADNDDAARRTAEKSLKLDERTPHPDKKLPDAVRQRMRELLADAAPDSVDNQPDPDS